MFTARLNGVSHLGHADDCDDSSLSAAFLVLLFLQKERGWFTNVTKLAVELIGSYNMIMW